MRFSFRQNGAEARSDLNGGPPGGPRLRHRPGERGQLGRPFAARVLQRHLPPGQERQTSEHHQRPDRPDQEGRGRPRLGRRQAAGDTAHTQVIEEIDDESAHGFR